MTSIDTLAAEVEAADLHCKEITKVVFTAVAEADGAIGPYNTRTTLVYSNVVTNVGDGYSEHTGVFVAPVDGVYYFTMFYHAGGKAPVSLTLYRNGDAIVHTSDQTSKSDRSDNGGNAAFIQLKRGDHVFVQMGQGSYVWAKSKQTTFSGFLVCPM